ncbi:MAG: Carboxypeptidase regulatory-like domain [Verrucomicrobia bacterium]|jgi:hypothetical protein|nr:Carboxypeptidase regulatory-like domain [Verrucomicrobiota bacterium]
MHIYLTLLFISLALLHTGCMVVPIPHATKQSPTIDGRVVDPQGNPIAGVHIKLLNELRHTGPRNDPATKPAETTSGPDGRFRLSSQHNFHLLWYGNISFSFHVPRGEYWTGCLIVSHADYSPLYHDSGSKTNRHLRDLTLTPATQL